MDNGITLQKPQRLLSLDALRGFDMFWIISGEGIFHGLANVVKDKYHLTQSTVNWQIATAGAPLNIWEALVVGISNQLHHSVWNGFTCYDMIFPLFIFIAGVSMPYSFGSKLEKGNLPIRIVKGSIYRALLKRTIILILLGMVVNGALQFKGYELTRFASVLGRIGLSCFFAGLIYLNTQLRGQIIWFVAILLGYWGAMTCISVPHLGAGNLTPEGNLSAYVDRLLLPGKLHRKVYDPEGLLSTIPAVATAMLGIFTGTFLKYQASNFTMIKKAFFLVIAGSLLVLLGWFWGMVFPINKNMWTSSFVVYTGGFSVLLFAFFYLIVDALQFQKWCKPFVWIGTNSILIYMAAHGLVNFEATSHFLFDGLISFTHPIWHAAMLWVGVAVIQFAALYFLFKQKWFLKI
ncbi:acyltransferase family protein [Parasediminibacterium paludis]|uniref:Acyltransferase family protein n=1 Tax=Parasediminibacterium paludis TaxID=908966 RepID=A0ABV8PWY7_9BACT